jgi:CHAD domain-containing protein
MQTLPQYIGASAGVKALLRNSEVIRRQHHQKVDAALNEGKLQRLLLQIGAWMNGGYWEKLISRKRLPKFAAKILHQHKHKVLQYSGQIQSHADVAGLHVLRIACKNLRYSIELYASLYDSKKMRRYLKSLTQLQEVLGEMNDHFIAVRLLDEAGKSSPQKIIARLNEEIEQSQTQRLKKLRKSWKQFAGQKDFWD